MNAWEKRRQTITADELFSAASAPTAPSPAYSPPPTPRQGWLERKLKGAEAWPWREIVLTIGACVLGAAAFTFIGSLDLSLPSIPRRGEVALTATATPVTVERVVTSYAPPVVIIVTTTPPVVYAQPAAQPRPVQRQPVRSLPAPTVAPAAWPPPSTGGYLCQHCSGRGCDGFSPDKPIYLDPFAQVEGATIHYWTPHLSNMSNTTTFAGCRAR